nr:MobH family relaxase [uncultured Vibrio sp.]
MLKNILLNLMSRSTLPIESVYSTNENKDEKSIYPPERKGIKIVHKQDLMLFFRNDIEEIKKNFSLGNLKFEQYLYPVIKNVIEFVSSLPASQYHHHSAPNGLAFHLLDVTKRVTLKAKISHFPSSLGNLHSGQRCVPQRTLACCLGALIHDVGKVITDMTISNGKHGYEKIIWHPLGDLSIDKWASEHGVSDIFVDWKANRHNQHEQASVALSLKLIPEATWRWLANCVEGQDICIELWNAISWSGDDSQVKTIVKQADVESVKFDLSFQYKHWSLEPVRRPINELIKTIVKWLISNGDWQINRKDGVLWFVDDILYISWAKAVSELKDHLDNLDYSIPTNPDTLAKALIDECFADINGEDMYFYIYPEILGSDRNPVRLKCLKVNNVASVVPEPEKLYPITQHKLRKKLDELRSQDKCASNTSNGHC